MGPNNIAMTVAEYAADFRISKSTAYARIRDKKVLARKIGRKTVIFWVDNPGLINDLPFKNNGGK